MTYFSGNGNNNSEEYLITFNGKPLSKLPQFQEYNPPCTIDDSVNGTLIPQYALQQVHGSLNRELLRTRQASCRLLSRKDRSIIDKRSNKLPGIYRRKAMAFRSEISALEQALKSGEL